MRNPFWFMRPCRFPSGWLEFGDRMWSKSRLIDFFDVNDSVGFPEGAD